MPPGEPPADEVVGRLAPSPTGALHLGHARTFLLAYWSIRAQGGRLLLRHEDLDTDRARPEWIDAAREDLEWLGLDWDAERVQSAGLSRIRDAAFSLLERGRAYPCSCSRGDVRSALSAPHGPELEYPGTCRDRYRDLADAEARSGKPAGLRFRTEDRTFVFDDGLWGETAQNPSRQGGDFLILRRDKQPAYHLAVVVDDAFDGVTEVVRGHDLLAATPRQLALYEALGERPPRYFHVPLVCDEHGERLAKRAPRLGLAEQRARGTDPRRIVAWAAASAGLECDGLVRAADLVPGFDLRRVPREPVRLSPDVLERLLG